MRGGVFSQDNKVISTTIKAFNKIIYSKQIKLFATLIILVISTKILEIPIKSNQQNYFDPVTSFFPVYHKVFSGKPIEKGKSNLSAFPDWRII